MEDSIIEALTAPATPHLLTLVKIFNKHTHAHKL
jgi:hypothetical protein